MRYGFFAMGVMLFGMVTLVIIVMFESITINNDSEYYSLKEAMRASMIEALDKDYGRVAAQRNITCKLDDGTTVEMSGKKMIEQKFVENFTRRFVATINNDAKKYTLEFYDIMEMPPKATVKITGNTTSYNNALGDDINIINSLTGILETECYRP